MSQCLTGKTIGELSTLSGLSGNTLFIVEQDGVTYNIPFSAFGIDVNSCLTEVLTYSQMTGKTSTNSLKPGCFYMITDADPTLYSGGTNIVIQAITNNQLALQGHGLFYTPPYDQNIAGFGIWTPRVTITLMSPPLWSNPSLNFGPANLVTSYFVGIGSGTGYEVNISIVSGNVTFNSVVSYGYGYQTGDVLQITAAQVGGNFGDDIYFLVTNAITYDPGDTTIWGGYVWENLTGNLGSSTDLYNLDNTNWSAKTYNYSGYNTSIDVIHYDYDNDTIIYRKDKLNNEVSVSKSLIDFFVSNYGLNPIKSFQWGNNYNGTVGVSNNHMIDSVFECINFRGGYLTFNTLENLSFIRNNSWENDSYFQSNTLDNSSSFVSNTLDNNSSFASNILYDSSFQSNTLDNNSYFQYSSLNNNSYFSSNTLNNNSYFQYSTLDNSSSIQLNSLTNASFIELNSLTNASSIELNTLNNGSTISNNTLNNNSSINSDDLDSNSLIFGNTLTDSSIGFNVLNNGNINYNILTKPTPFD
jgi:hypothetical protein